MTQVYSLSCPVTNSIRYIGISVNSRRRYSAHICETSSYSHKSNWIKGLRNKNLKPVLGIIDEVLDEEAGFWEQHYISLFKSWGFRLTNGTNGGDTISKNFYRKEWKKASEKTKKIMSINNSGKNNRCYGLFGKNHPAFGNKWSKKEYDKKCKKVYELNSTGKIIKVYRSISECKKAIGASGGTVNRACRNQLKSYKRNFRFKEDIESYKRMLDNMKVLQYDRKGNFIKEWESALEASINLKINTSSIYKCIRNEAKTCGKCVWKRKYQDNIYEEGKNKKVKQFLTIE